jgi:hypothetical protein
MRKYTFLVLFALIAAGGWYLFQNQDQIEDFITQHVDSGEFMTLEARYTADQIMAAHKKDLLTDSQKTFKDAELKFYPFLLMEVKYTDNAKPKEGVLLWGMLDGEMVINTETWEKTHGFEDAINAKATRNEFKVINALAKNKGHLSRDALLQELHLEGDIVDPWIDSSIQKHLVVRKGNELYLHLQNPKLAVSPNTKINQWLVTKPYNNVQRVSKKYSRSQIEKIAKAAFADLSIRNASEVSLPVYSIQVLNPDGSILTSYWNALNGERINPKYLAEVN